MLTNLQDLVKSDMLLGELSLLHPGLPCRIKLLAFRSTWILVWSTEKVSTMIED